MKSLIHRMIVLGILGVSCGCAGRSDTPPIAGEGGETGVGGATGSGGAGGVLTTSSHTSTGSGQVGPSSSASTASGLSCSDSGVEPNDSEGQATDLGMIDDCDTSQASTNGTLNGAEEDWFVYQGADSWGCEVDPTVQVASDASITVCQYFECSSGEPQVVCPNGMPEVSPGGLSGCCNAGGFTAQVTCSVASGIGDDSAIVYILLKQNADACSDYTLTYHF